ncbi:MAG: hypothetical protein IJ094_04700 [Bacilli bacterium]|nr:hypothetical protein [Bacilli bacterium]
MSKKHDNDFLMSRKFANFVANEYGKRIRKAIEYMKQYIEVEDAPINERIKIEFKEVLKILQGSDNNER